MGQITSDEGSQNQASRDIWLKAFVKYTNSSEFFNVKTPKGL